MPNQATFMTSDAIPWKPADPRQPDGVQIFVVLGESKRGPLGDPYGRNLRDKFMMTSAKRAATV